MHLEIRKNGKKKIYYLAYSFRDHEKVRKIRRYLGADLSEREIEEKRTVVGKEIEKQIEEYKRIRDPLHTVLSEEEIKQIENIIKQENINLERLDEGSWLKFTERFAYDTNAIEGSTVTFSEVRDILGKNKWPNKSRDDISETYGVAETIKYIRKTKEHLSLDLIKTLHKIIFKNSKSFAGKFRAKGVEVAVVDSHRNVIHRGAPQKQIIKLLKELVRWYEKNKNKYHPIVLAAVIHNQFENIHPFQDGNGRVGRLLLNNILLRHNMPPVNIELKNRFEYYKTLQAYEKEGNLRPTIEFIIKEYKSFNQSK